MYCLDCTELVQCCELVYCFFIRFLVSWRRESSETTKKTICPFACNWSSSTWTTPTNFNFLRLTSIRWFIQFFSMGLIWWNLLIEAKKNPDRPLTKKFDSFTHNWFQKFIRRDHPVCNLCTLAIGHYFIYSSTPTFMKFVEPTIRTYTCQTR